MNRRLAAILAADMVGYSRLMAADETGTLVRLKTLRADLIDPKITKHKGRIVKEMGDGLLVEFASVIDAMQCAVEMQQGLAERNAGEVEDRRIEFRMGVNLGDIIVEGDDIYGDGVNIASRLQGLAEPGNIWISGKVREELGSKLELGFEDLGEHELKNIPQPLRVFRVTREAGEELAPIGQRRERAISLQRLAVAAVAVIILGGVAGWYLFQGIEPRTEQVTAEDPILQLPKGPRIAVLPFDNLSGDPKQGFFSEGITEEIITQLSRFPELFVIARHTSAQYRNKPARVEQIGRELDVRYVLEGSVRRSADTIRVTAQLIDATTGTHLWAETFDRELTADNVFEVQDDITVRIASTVGSSGAGVISRTAVEKLRGRRTDSLEAYECVLLVGEYYRLITPDAHKRARDCLERAVALDPDYGRAWAGLAHIYQQEYALSFNLGPAPLERALEAGERAVALDPESAYAHAALATVHFFRQEHDAFVAKAEKALGLNPNVSLYSLGFFFSFMGDWDRGLSLIRKSHQLNPKAFPTSYWPIYLDHYRKGQYEDALDLALKTAIPAFFATHINLAAIYAQLGREDEASASIAKLLELRPGFTITQWREESSKWNWFNIDIGPAMEEGLRKAGLPE